MWDLGFPRERMLISMTTTMGGKGRRDEVALVLEP